MNATMAEATFYEVCPLIREHLLVLVMNVGSVHSLAMFHHHELDLADCMGFLSWMTLHVLFRATRNQPSPKTMNFYSWIRILIVLFDSPVLLTSW